MGVPVVSKLTKKVFGTRNDRLVKRYLRIVEEVSDREPAIRAMTDATLRAQAGLRPSPYLRVVVMTDLSTEDEPVSHIRHS